MHPIRTGFVTVAVVLATIAGSARAAASPQSVERLMRVMKVEAQLDTIYSQTLPAMQNMMRQSLGQEMQSAEAERVLNAAVPRINKVVREELSWARLKPDFAAIYSDTFTQEEIDGLIAFYEGPIGSALVSKLPQLTQRSIQMMQQRMPAVMQKAMQVAKEEVDKERARSGKPQR
jgi:hypothetical protein